MFNNTLYRDYRYRERGDLQERFIPASDFEVFDATRTVSKIEAIIAILSGAGFLVGFFGLLVVSTLAYSHPWLIWLPLNLMALSAAPIVGIVAKRAIAAICFYLKHQARVLHNANSIEEYKKILATDKNVHYVFRMPGFRENHLNQLKGTNHRAQAELDHARKTVYYHNGKQINNPKEVYRNNLPFANQSIASDIQSILASRYNNEDLEILVAQKDVPHVDQPSPILRFDLEDEGKTPYLTATCIYQLKSPQGGEEVLSLGYIKAQMRINLSTGDAIISWKSPQNEDFTSLEN